MSSSKRIIFVIDTSAIINQIQFAAEDIQLVTPPLVEKEMYDKGLRETVELLIATKKLGIIEPTAASLDEVKKTAIQLGDLSYLSEPDQHLLALALDFSRKEVQPIVVTDDYSIQNVARHLSLNYKTATQAGIREIIRWQTYCSACGYKDPAQTGKGPCPVCGTPLKRRAIRKQAI